MKIILLTLLLISTYSHATPNKKLAASIIINKGYLCTQVITIIPFNLNAKKVECFIHKNKMERAIYILNNNTGTVRDYHIQQK